MKRLCLCMFLMLSFLLTGCGAKKEEKLLNDFSTALSGRNDLTFVGKLRCEYDDRTVNFTLQYKQRDNGCEVSVLQPEGIEGLSVELDEKGSVLHYDELFIDTGKLDHFGLSPLSALPLIVNTLKSPYLDSVRSENNLTVYSLIPADDIQVDVGFDENTLPVRAELISDGKVRVFCDIESWY